MCVRVGVDVGVCVCEGVCAYEGVCKHTESKPGVKGWDQWAGPRGRGWSQETEGWVPEVPEEEVTNGLVFESSLEEERTEVTVQVRLKLEYLYQLKEIHVQLFISVDVCVCMCECGCVCVSVGVYA